MKSAPFRNIEVLVVDDEPALRDTVSRNILSLGYSVTSAETAEKALEQIAVKPLNILVSDVKMGKMDGLELGNRLREKDGAIAIIFMTGKPNPKDMASAQNMGAIQYISKPFGLVEFAENLAIAARWNIAQLIGKAAEKYFALRGGRMSVLENKFQRMKTETKNVMLNKGDASLLVEMAYAKSPQSTRLCSLMDERMAPHLRTVNK